MQCNVKLSIIDITELDTEKHNENLFEILMIDNEKKVKSDCVIVLYESLFLLCFCKCYDGDLRV